MHWPPIGITTMMFPMGMLNLTLALTSRSSWLTVHLGAYLGNCLHSNCIVHQLGIPVWRILQCSRVTFHAKVKVNCKINKCSVHEAASISAECQGQEDWGCTCSWGMRYKSSRSWLWDWRSPQEFCNKRVQGRNLWALPWIWMTWY